MGRRVKHRALEVSGLGHIALRVTDLARAKACYTGTLGFEVMLETEGLVPVNGYGILLGMKGNDPHTPRGDRFAPHRVGRDHLALAVAERDTLDRLAVILNAAGVRHNGSEEDPLTRAPYSSFYDPDGIAWEFYVFALPSA